MLLRPPAKVNLTLEVLDTREDGYHEIRTILQAIDLRDTLLLEWREAGLEFHCLPPYLEGSDNLALQAVRLLKETARCSQGVSIHLRKDIPEGMGLGGGSSDAAITLWGLNRLWGLGLSGDVLGGLAAQLGSDAPFFLYQGAALAQGRGERVNPLPSLTTHWVVLLLPPLPVPSQKTKQLYAGLQPKHFTEGEHTRRAVEAWGEKWHDELYFNVFEKVAWEQFPGLEVYCQLFQQVGARRVHLAGSGPALFTILSQEDSARVCYDTLMAQGQKTYLARTLGPLDTTAGE